MQLRHFICAMAALLAGLHLLGSVDGFAIDWADPAGWIDKASPEQAVAGVLRVAALLVGYLVLGSTVIYYASGRSPRARRRLRFVVLPPIRRMVDRALAAALTATVVASPLSPATAEEPPPAVVLEISNDGIPIPHIRLETPLPEIDNVDASAAAETVVPASPPARKVPVTTAITTGDGDDRYTVVAGDNLWTIAENALQSTSDDPGTAEVVQYWRTVIAANASSLRSGDPNLIFPGEILTLPPREVSP